MKKIMFNNKFGLTNLTLEGRKTQTRRLNPIYEVGEVVAIAQSYSSICEECPCKNHFWDCKLPNGYADTPGWKNKMFVKAEAMPNRIRITGVKKERLNDISDEDCIREGVIKSGTGFGLVNERGEKFYFVSLRLAYRYLINKVTGRDIWKEDPIVFAYDFELIK